MAYYDGLEIGYHMFETDSRNKGLMTESLALLVRYLFTSKKINRLQLTVMLPNVASRRVAQKCGFKLEGIARGAIFHKGQNHDLEMLLDFAGRSEARMNGSEFSSIFSHPETLMAPEEFLHHAMTEIPEGLADLNHVVLKAPSSVPSTGIFACALNDEPGFFEREWSFAQGLNLELLDSLAASSNRWCLCELPKGGLLSAKKNSELQKVMLRFLSDTGLAVFSSSSAGPEGTLL